MGDFDGDQMACFLIPKDHEEEVMDKMSPVNLKFYDKDLSPLISPSHGVMHGYIGCSKVDYTISKRPKRVDTLEDLEDLYNKEEVDLQELVYLGEGKPTTFGRAKIEEALGTSINKALGFSDEDALQPIDHKNVTDLMRYISNRKDSARISRDIQQFVLEMSTIEGFSSLSLNQLYSGIPKEFIDELEDLRNDSSLNGVQKFIRINEVNNKMKSWVQENMDPDLRQTMVNSSRMKISALLEMTLPAATITDDGEILSNEKSLYESLTEEEYRSHSLQNRMVLDLKQKMVPRSGNLNRQITFLAQGLEFKRDLTDEKNTGILIPKKNAEGRTTLDGKLVRKSNSDELIRVRSIAVTDKKYVCPDHLSQKYFPKDEITPAWGLRAVTSLTEAMTQKGLSLKHSGSFVQVPVANRLFNTANVKGEVQIDPSKGVINLLDKSGKISATYPLPNRFDVMNSELKGNNDFIGTTLATSSAGLGLDQMIKIMNAKKVMVDEGLAKNIITLSNCYAPIDGEIKYDFEKNIYFVGSQLMGKIDRDAVFYYPQGYKVKKYQRIMSNPLNPSWYLDNGYPLEEVYFLFRKEFKSLAGNKTTEELLETLFHLLVKKDFKTGKHTYMGVQRGIRKGNDSFFAQLSFERGKDAISRLSSGELKFENDIFTKNILDHLIISAKDRKNLVKK